jgi:hypothetical protein
MSYYSSFYDNNDVYDQPATPFTPFDDDFMKFHGGIPQDDFFSNDDVWKPTPSSNNDVYYPQSIPSSMRYPNYYNNDHREIFFLLYALISLGVPIICWITCCAEGLLWMGMFRMGTLAGFLFSAGHFEFGGFEVLGGILWIIIAITIIYKRGREQRERVVERIPEDVEDPIVLTTTEDNHRTVVAAHCINSRLPREDTRTTLQGRVNYHEIVHAKIVDMGSSSTSTQVGDPQNTPSWSPHEDVEYSGPAAIAVPERGVGMGLEPHRNRFEEVVINRPRFTFAVAGSVEMANLNVRQLNQHQNVDTFERGMSLFDRYSSQEKDENEIV